MSARCARCEVELDRRAAATTPVQCYNPDEVVCQACWRGWPVRARLASRLPAYTPGPEQIARLDAFFAAHPEVDEVYLFHDGRVIALADYQARMTSRTAQLVAIATDGFPVNLHRTSYRRGVR